MVGIPSSFTRENSGKACSRPFYSLQKSDNDSAMQNRLNII